jgi:hypothetical protein
MDRDHTERARCTNPDFQFSSQVHNLIIFSPTNNASSVNDDQQEEHKTIDKDLATRSRSTRPPTTSSGSRAR